MACWMIKGQKRVKSMHIINMENHEISIPAEILKKNAKNSLLVMKNFQNHKVQMI